jgi:hypothetical protein
MPASAIFKKLNLKEQTGLVVLNAPSSFESEHAILTGIPAGRPLANWVLKACARSPLTRTGLLCAFDGLSSSSHSNGMLRVHYLRKGKKGPPERTNRIFHQLRPVRLNLKISGGASCVANTIPIVPFEPTRKRRKGFPSETKVKRGHRFVHGGKELLEKLGRNDLCPCGSARRFQEMLYEKETVRRFDKRSLLLGNESSLNKSFKPVSGPWPFTGSKKAAPFWAA